MNLQRRFFLKSFIVVAAAFSICFSFVAPASAQYGDHTVKVMTRNMYPGADLGAIASVPAEGLDAAIQATIEDVFQSRIPERAALVAAEIIQNKPDIVALQEATQWKISTLQGEVVLDQLELLMKSLRRAGLQYRVAVVQQMTHVEIPDAITYTDRNAVLVRHNMPLQVLGTETHTFSDLLTIPVPSLDTEISILRGWIEMDVKVQGRHFKFVNTHLESPLPGPYQAGTQGLQVLQAMELMQELAPAKVPVILAGDFNSNAEAFPPGYPPDQTPSYMMLSAVYHDPWHLFHSDPGYTWPMPVILPIKAEDFYERIDFTLSDTLDPVSIERVGTDPVDGLLASDHAGVVAEFELEKTLRKNIR